MKRIAFVVAGIAIVGLGFFVSANGYLDRLFHTTPHDVFFSTIPELENFLVQDSGDEGRTKLSLFYTNFSPPCGPMVALNELQKNLPPDLDATIYVDSSFRPHDIANIRDNLGIGLPVKVLPESISDKWIELEEKRDMSYEGIAALIEHNKIVAKTTLNQLPRVTEFLKRFE